MRTCSCHSIVNVIVSVFVTVFVSVSLAMAANRNVIDVDCSVDMPSNHRCGPSPHFFMLLFIKIPAECFCLSREGLEWVGGLAPFRANLHCLAGNMEDSRELDGKDT